MTIEFNSPGVIPGGWSWTPAPTGANDAFGRQRVSQVTTLLDVKHPNSKNPALVDEELNGTATSVHSTTNASVNMTTAADADYVIRQTFQRAPYFAGKGQQAFLTFCNFVNETNVTKRIGLFQSATTGTFSTNIDGIFIESDGSDYYCCIYKGGTQTARIARADWTDPMDGSGPSGITIDFTKSLILQIDYEWLGVGSVRFCVVIDGVMYEIARYNHSNAGVSTYMTHSNQPIRYEIRQAGEGSGSLEMVCSTIGTEGVNQIGEDGTVNQGVIHTDADSTTNTYALCGIRLDTAKPNIHLHISGISILSTTNDNFLWSIIRNPSVAGTFTFASNNGVQTAVAAGNTNIVTGGTVLASGYGAANSEITFAHDTALHLGISIDGTPDEFILCVRATGVNSDLIGAVNWFEEI